jgi:hypothetical protein
MIAPGFDIIGNDDRTSGKLPDEGIGQVADAWLPHGWYAHLMREERL